MIITELDLKEQDLKISLMKIKNFFQQHLKLG